MIKVFKIEVDCAACAGKMETAACKTKGVKRAIVNFMTGKMTVEFCSGEDITKVTEEMVKNCKKVAYGSEIYL